MAMEWFKLALDAARISCKTPISISIISNPHGGTISIVHLPIRDGIQLAPEHVLAMAGAGDSITANRLLVQILARDDNYRMLTGEVAQTLGITEGRVRGLIQNGLLTPVKRGNSRSAAMFDPKDVYAWATHERRRIPRRKTKQPDAPLDSSAPAC